MINQTPRQTGRATGLSEPKETDMILYGYLSPTALRRHGGARYSTPAGTEITVSCVGQFKNPQDDGYMWSDAVLVGEVVKLVSDIPASPGNSHEFVP